MTKKTFTAKKIREFFLASLILSVLHWLVVSKILKVIPSTFPEFFLSSTYVLFVGVMTLSFLVIQFFINTTKTKMSTLLRGAKYYAGLLVGVLFVLKEPLSGVFLAVTILKVLITTRILEK